MYSFFVNYKSYNIGTDMIGGQTAVLALTSTMRLWCLTPLLQLVSYQLTTMPVSVVKSTTENCL